MSTEIIPFLFEGAEVRATLIDGEPWWVLADVARALGIINARDISARLDDDEKGVAQIDTLGGLQAVSIINEPGLYSTVLRSEKPHAKRFQRWITHEVVPQIRKTGKYEVAPVASVPDLELDVSAIKQLHQAVTVLLEHNERITAKLTAATPRAEAWDALASAEGDYSVGDAAKMLARAGIPTGPTRLFNQLCTIKWTYRGADAAWRPYADRVEKGYLSEKPSFHYHPGTGERVVDPPQVRVTVKGLERLRQRLHVGALAVVAS